MKQITLIIFLGLASPAGHAYLGHHSIADSQFETFRAGWPPHFNAILSDWGLRGPIKCVTSKQEDGKNRSEILCFDRQGRLETATFEEYVTSQFVLTYDGRHLKSMVQRFDSGEVSTVVFEYDKAGAVVRAVRNSTIDFSVRKRFRKERFDEDPKDPQGLAREREHKPDHQELTFRYDQNGFIARMSCRPISANSQCIEDEEEFTVDQRGRPIKAVLPNTRDMTAPLDLNPNAPRRPPARARMEASYDYEKYPQSVMHTSTLNGKVFSVSGQSANERGDIIISMHKSAYSDTDVRYSYTYDSHQNWVRRDGNDLKNGPVPAIVRELTYWDR